MSAPPENPESPSASQMQQPETTGRPKPPAALSARFLPCVYVRIVPSRDHDHPFRLREQSQVVFLGAGGTPFPVSRDKCHVCNSLLSSPIGPARVADAAAHVSHPHAARSTPRGAPATRENTRATAQDSDAKHWPDTLEAYRVTLLLQVKSPRHPWAPFGY